MGVRYPSVQKVGVNYALIGLVLSTMKHVKEKLKFLHISSTDEVVGLQRRDRIIHIIRTANLFIKLKPSSQIRAVNEQQSKVPCLTQPNRLHHLLTAYTTRPSTGTPAYLAEFIYNRYRVLITGRFFFVFPYYGPLLPPNFIDYLELCAYGLRPLNLEKLEILPI